MARRNNGEGSVYRRADGKWIACCTIGFRDGKQVRRTKVCTSALQAREALRELQAETGSGLLLDGKTKLADWLPRWLADSVTTRSAANTVYSYRLACTNHIVPTLGAIEVNAITVAHVERLIARLQRNGVGQRTLQNAFVVLSKAMSDAVRLGLRADNPCVAISKPRYRADKAEPFQAVEVQRILKATQGTRWHLFVMLAFSCGLRRGELIGLRWQSIRIGKRSHLVIDQQQTQVGGKSIAGRPKTESSVREIPLTADAVEAVRQHRELMKQDGLPTDDYVFVGSRGNHISVSGLAKNFWQPLLRKLGIEHRGLHHCRHTFASFAIQSGISIVELSRMLGHAKPSTTLDIYSHVVASLQDTVTAKLGTMYR